MTDEYNTKGRILEAMKEVIGNGAIPKRLHIDRIFECEMCLLGQTEVGKDLAASILQHGPRKTIQDKGNTLFGMEVIWDASAFKVEP